MKSSPICLDASYLIGLFDPRDTWHESARQIHATLRELRAPAITPDCVLNEVFTVLARRGIERGEAGRFSALVGQITGTIPETSITWLYPHVPRWFAACVTIMQETAGALNFHDALLVVAAEEVDYQAIVSFDAGFDRLDRLRRLGTANAVSAWLQASPEA